MNTEAKKSKNHPIEKENSFCKPPFVSILLGSMFFFRCLSSRFVSENHPLLAIAIATMRPWAQRAFFERGRSSASVANVNHRAASDRRGGVVGLNCLKRIPYLDGLRKFSKG